MPSPSSNRPRPARLALLGLALAALLLTGCSTVSYLARQGVGQLRLLRARRPVEAVLADRRTPPLLRQRLRVVLEARAFGISQLGLSDSADFTRYVDTGGPVAYNLSAAQRTRLRGLTWTFPLIGTVPYLGYFRRDEAEAEARRLQAQGYDTYLRPVAAYSALGYLISPIYASMLDDPDPAGEARAVETVLHEMAHCTAYINSASDLNESYATLVGVQGAALFYRLRGDAGAGERLLREAQQAEQRAAAFSAWLQPALAELRAFYDDAQRRGLPAAEILRQREARLQALSASYRAAFPSGPRYRRLAEGPVNNAVLLAFGVYHRSGDLQQRLLDSVGRDLRAYVDLYRRAQGRGDGAAWLRVLAAEQRARSAAAAPEPG